MTTVKVFAPAKINLTLHVTGQRDDGYHLLDSLVVFASVGDRITLTESDHTTLTVTGPFGPGLPVGDDNLALKAARLIDLPHGVDITLEKNLPPVSGIGGGSADAAAVVRGMMAFQLPHLDWSAPSGTFADAALAPIAKGVLALGADVPMCLRPVEARIRGIGDRIDFATDLPSLPAILVTPPSTVSTPEVFRALRTKTNAPMPEQLPNWKTVEDFAHWILSQRNDLQSPSIAKRPIIAEVLKAIDDQGALVSRMSGSGATCFGVFPDLPSAEAAATAILLESDRRWWVKSCTLGGQFGRARPELS